MYNLHFLSYLGHPTNHFPWQYHTCANANRLPSYFPRRHWFLPVRRRYAIELGTILSHRQWKSLLHLIPWRHANHSHQHRPRQHHRHDRPRYNHRQFWTRNNAPKSLADSCWRLFAPWDEGLPYEDYDWQLTRTCFKRMSRVTSIQTLSESFPRIDLTKRADGHKCSLLCRVMVALANGSSLFFGFGWRRSTSESWRVCWQKEAQTPIRNKMLSNQLKWICRLGALSLSELLATSTRMIGDYNNR